jgi:hypothetical protein
MVGKQTIVSTTGYTIDRLLEWDAVEDATGNYWLVASCEKYYIGNRLEFYKSTLVLICSDDFTMQQEVPS